MNENAVTNTKKTAKNRLDIQTLIPESHRDLVEAVPRGFLRSGVNGAILLGALAGALLTFIVPSWIAAAVPLCLLVVHLFWRWKSDKLFDERMAELAERDLDWDGEAGR